MESFINQDPTDIASGFIAQAATIDPVNTSHLYYISSSHLPRMLLVNIDFDGNGFVGWKRGGLIALTAKNKAGIIDGSSPKPAVDSELHKAWLMANNMMGGRANLHNELLCRFTFPEKAGALSKSIDAFSPRWNISLIHYRAQGQIGANVLVGLQVLKDEFDEFQGCARRLGYEYVVESLNDAFKLIMH